MILTVTVATEAHIVRVSPEYPTVAIDPLLRLIPRSRDGKAAKMILVVDDHHPSSRALVVLLKMEGFEAAAVECATNALEMMKRRKPSLVILDCHMPEFDGFMMLQALKMTPNLADVPVVMLSAGDAGDEARSLELGARAFLRKGSVDWRRILDVVNSFASNADASAKH